MRTNGNLIGKINFYASSVDVVEAARPLHVIEALDIAESAIRRIISDFSARLEYGGAIIDEISSVECPIDEDILDKIERDQEVIRVFRDTLVKNSQKIKDCCLPDETLHDEVCKAIKVSEELFDQQEEIRWAVMEHNVDALPKGKANSLSSEEDIEAFFADL